MGMWRGLLAPRRGETLARPDSEEHRREGLAVSSPSSCPVPGTGRPISSPFTPQICGQHPSRLSASSGHHLSNFLVFWESVGKEWRCTFADKTQQEGVETRD